MPEQTVLDQSEEIYIVEYIKLITIRYFPLATTEKMILKILVKWLSISFHFDFLKQDP